MEVFVKIEASVTVEAENVERAMDMVEQGKVSVNPCVLLRCREQGLSRLADIHSIVFWAGDGGIE